MVAATSAATAMRMTVMARTAAAVARGGRGLRRTMTSLEVVAALLLPRAATAGTTEEEERCLLLLLLLRRRGRRRRGVPLLPLRLRLSSISRLSSNDHHLLLPPRR